MIYHILKIVIIKRTVKYNVFSLLKIQNLLYKKLIIIIFFNKKYKHIQDMYCIYFKILIVINLLTNK
jgi:hypothetical protein